ncbi:MAG: J domain-containing protein [Candidatus Eremiobacteraeota bacterium]|nr:J domain-containing protein [Candidatus Eremiobacteraeota bacterium]
MERGFTYYDTLGVSQTATREEIHDAYRASVRTYHPDVNQAPYAQQFMSVLNDAWHTLSDSERRVAYDDSLNRKDTATVRGRPRVWQLLRCERCNRSDLHLRIAVFYYVWSFLVFSRLRSFAGILCTKCRSVCSVQSAAFSALLGPWALPSGLVLTAKALRAAARGGEQPPAQNALLLRHQAMALLQHEDVAGAKTALIEAQKYQRHPIVEELLHDPEILQAHAPPPPRWIQGQIVALATGPIILAVAMVVIFALFNHPKVTSAIRNAKNTQAPVSYVSSRGSFCLNEVRRTLKGPSLHTSQKQMQGLRGTCIAAAKELSPAVFEETPGNKVDEQRYAFGMYLAYGGIADIKLDRGTQGRSELNKARAEFRALAAYSPNELIRTKAADFLRSIVPWMSTQPPT